MDGLVDGAPVEPTLGLALGDLEGEFDGYELPPSLGLALGDLEGELDGYELTLLLGLTLGAGDLVNSVGCSDGPSVGADVVGETVGVGCGISRKRSFGSNR